MKLLYKNSLAKTIDAVNEALFFNKKIPASQKKGMEKLLAGHVAGGQEFGTFCCVTCSCALWRNAAEGGLKNSKKLLDAGLKILKSNRDGKGRWGRFPFYYTLLALSEIDSTKAKAELKYCQPACEKSLKRLSKKDDIISKRRRKILIKSVKV